MNSSAPQPPHRAAPASLSRLAAPPIRLSAMEVEVEVADGEVIIAGKELLD